MKEISHREKQRMARRMRSKWEVQYNIPIFQTKAWNERKENNAMKVQNREVSAQYRKENHAEI